MGCKTNCIVVDIDDTLIDTKYRLQQIWLELLGQEVPLEIVETQGLEQIFMKFASEKQKTQVRKFQKQFWDLLLCLDERGVKSFELHRPISSAANVLQAWNKTAKIVYLTGRTENTRSLTLGELRRFGFPVEDSELVMFSPESYARPKGENPSGPTLIDTRFHLCSEICKKFDAIRVIDDYPRYFPVFRKLNIPDRIGFLRSKKYKPQHYMDRGATRVITEWQELRNLT